MPKDMSSTCICKAGVVFLFSVVLFGVAGESGCE